MSSISKKLIQGDKTLWFLVSFLLLFSILPIYSIYVGLDLIKKRILLTSISKHIFLVITGFCIIIIIHLINYRYTVFVSIITTPFIILLLIITFLQGYSSKSVISARWIHIPIINFSFQTSTVSNLIATTFYAKYLAIMRKHNFKNSIIKLSILLIIMVMLILPSNASSAIMLFASIIIILFIGEYPFKKIIKILCILILLISIFLVSGLIFEKSKSFSRITTWQNRLIVFFTKKYDKTTGYQINKSIISIISGHYMGLGPGKSVLKMSLPQASSDFIYAIIIEEYGLLGGVIIILIYLSILLRILIIARKSKNYFRRLLVLSLGIPIIIQALVHMGVNVDLLPVTGQDLPLIGSGGTSIFISCFRFGVILNIDRNNLNDK